MNYRNEDLVQDMVERVWKDAQIATCPLKDAYHTLAQIRKAFIATEKGAELQNSLRFVLELERGIMHTARRAGYFN